MINGSLLQGNAFINSFKVDISLQMATPLFFSAILSMK